MKDVIHALGHRFRVSDVTFMVSLVSASMLIATAGTTGQHVFAIGFAIWAVVSALVIDAFRCDCHFAKRMEADAPITWDVELNGIKIGTVTDGDYAAMQRCALRDGRLAVAQFLNMGHMALVVVDKLLVTVPLLVFWAAVALAIFPPESYTDMALELQKADPAAITSAALSLLYLALIVMFFSAGGMVMMGYRFGFRNHYSEAVNRMLQQHCNTPADGAVQCRPKTPTKHHGSPVA